MTWASGAQDAPRLADYEAAKAHEARVVPIRGRKDECKPLGRRACTGLTIHKEGRTIVVRYHTMSVTYRPGGRIDVHVPWCMYTNTTPAVLLRSLLGVHTQYKQGRTYMYVVDGSEKGSSAATPMPERFMGWYPMAKQVRTVSYSFPSSSPGKPPTTRTYKQISFAVALRHAPTPTTQPHRTGSPRYYGYHNARYATDYNIPYPKQVRVNRKGANAVRKRYAGFLKLVSGVSKLTEANKETYGSKRGTTAKPLSEMRRAVRGSAGKQLELARYLCERSVDSSGNYDYRTRAYNIKYFLNQRALKNSVDEIILHAHMAEAFFTKTVTDGRVPTYNKHNK
jgi:hypothetical protein